MYLFHKVSQMESLYKINFYRCEPHPAHVRPEDQAVGIGLSLVSPRPIVRPCIDPCFPLSHHGQAFSDAG